MQLLILRPHRYYSRGEQRLYLFQPGEIREVADGLGLRLLAAHPDKFSLVDGKTGQEGSLQSGGERAGVADAAMEEPPQDKLVRRSRKPRGVNAAGESPRK